MQSSVSLMLGANLENLTLTGAAAINGTGNTLANVLHRQREPPTPSMAAPGADTLIGGLGNDTYVTDGGDTLTEAVNGGTDRVQSSVSLTLGANLENLTLTGAAAINGTGNTPRQHPDRQWSRQHPERRHRADTLIGGLGNDTYFTDGGDTITEAVNGGTDLVRSSVSLTLGANLENLTLTGAAAINGTGNTLNNVLTGNAAANSLNGGTGADTLIGGLGERYLHLQHSVGAGKIDNVAHFNVADDIIRIDNVVFTGLPVGLLSAAAFFRVMQRTTAMTSLIYNKTSDALLFDMHQRWRRSGRALCYVSRHLLRSTSTEFVLLSVSLNKSLASLRTSMLVACPG